MGDIKLGLPLKDIDVVQYFGQEFLYYNPNTGKAYPFYKSYGLLGHPGIDFKAKVGCPVYSANEGVCMYAGYDETNGNMVQIWNEQEGFKTMYGHNSELKVAYGDVVKRGQLIALSGRTGAGTGPHVHFGLKLTGAGGNGLNNDNGYNGSIDPAPYFLYAYNGFNIGSKDWYRSRSYHRYYRDAKRDWFNEMKTALYMARRLKRLPNNEEINMAIWGGWDMDAILNPAMYEITSQLKKDEYNKGFKPFG